MAGDADIAALGALIGDPARARVLQALADGRALPASVLADEAGVAASTASAHLRKLVAADLLVAEPHGRHRYFRLAGPRVARLIEVLAEHAPPAPVRSLRDGTRAHALRRARLCYDHLGGRLGVALMGALLERGALEGDDGAFHPERAGEDRLSAPGRDADYRLTGAGAAQLEAFGIALDPLRARRRPLVRYCVDWSEQRHHLAGGLGAALAAAMLERRWLERAPQGRAVFVTRAGERGLREAFGIELAA
jgi:DNA-binding transcriptional ArsR family regulator